MSRPRSRWAARPQARSHRPGEPTRSPQVAKAATLSTRPKPGGGNRACARYETTCPPGVPGPWAVLGVPTGASPTREPSATRRAVPTGPTGPTGPTSGRKRLGPGLQRYSSPDIGASSAGCCLLRIWLDTAVEMRATLMRSQKVPSTNGRRRRTGRSGAGACRRLIDEELKGNLVSRHPAIPAYPFGQVALVSSGRNPGGDSLSPGRR